MCCCCKFDYQLKDSHKQYMHVINMKRDASRNNNWAVCDSALNRVYYIDSPNPRDYLLLQDTYFQRIKYYHLFVLRPKEYKGKHAYQEKMNDISKCKRLMTGERDHIRKA